MSASERRSLLRGALCAAVLSLAACGSDDAPVAAGAAGATAAVTAGPPPSDASVPAPSAASAPAATDAAPATSAVAGAAPVLGPRELSHPEDLQMVMLGYRLQGRVPPLAEWAAAQPGVKYANEFERAALLAQETARFQDIFDATAGVGRLRLNVNSRLSEYDAGRGGFYVDAYLPGSGFTFAVQPASYPVREERVTLSIEDNGELNFWPVDATTAQQALARNQNLREVLLDSELMITGASRRSDSVVITARLLGYGIVSSHYDHPVRLGERRFDGAGE